MKIVMTGGTGFIGNEVLHYLISKKDVEIVYVVVRADSPNKAKLPKTSKLKVIELYMEKIEELNIYIKEKISVFYHFAWKGIRGNERDDALMQRLNYDNTLKSYEAAKKLNCDKFIVSGSQAEYGDISGAVSENTQCRPVTMYGKAKLQTCQDLLQREKECKKPMLIWGRLFSVYGANDYSKSLITSTIEKLRNNEPVVLNSGRRIWDYTYIQDVAKAFYLLAARNCESGIYNISKGEARELYLYIEQMKKIMGSKSMIQFEDKQEHLGGMYPVVDKIQEAVRWKAEIDFEQGIKEILKEYQISSYADLFNV